MLLIFLFAAMFFSAGHSDHSKIPIEKLRVLFWQSGNDKQAIMPFYKTADCHQNSDSPLLRGYLGVATMMRARITGNPFKKWYLFNKGKVLLERAIDEDPNVLELRFLRLTVQKELPGILDYNSSIKTDRKFIMNHISDFMNESLNNEIFGRKILGYLFDKKMIESDQISRFSLNQK